LTHFPPRCRTPRANSAGKQYDVLLKERILEPTDLKDTVLSLRAGDHPRLLQGHNFDGKPLPDVKTPLIAGGASGIYSTPDDSCAGYPGTSIALHRRRRRSGSSIMLHICNVTASVRF
jgi:hypothetical protein